MARGHQRDGQERGSQPRGTLDKDPRDRNTGAARASYEKHTIDGRFDVRNQSRTLANTSDDILVDALSPKVTFDDFSKLIEESLVRCSECVQTVKDGLKTINKDINEMESEMSAFVENIKTFESATESCTNMRKTPTNNEEMVDTGKSNNSYDTQRHEKRGTKNNKGTMSQNTKHNGTNNKPHSAESSQAKKCIFPPINTKPSLTGARQRSPKNGGSFHDQTGESKLSQIKKIAKKRSIEQHHQKNMADERLVLKSLRNNKVSAVPDGPSYKVKGRSKVGSVYNKNANGLVVNETCGSKHEGPHSQCYNLERSSYQKMDRDSQGKRTSNARNGDKLQVKQHCKDVNASRARSKDISPYAEKQLLTSLINPDKSTLQNQPPNTTSEDTKPRKPVIRRSNFKLESWKTNNGPESNTDDVPIPADSFGHHGNKIGGTGVDNKLEAEDEKQASRKARTVIKKTQCQSKQKKRWQ